MQISDNAQEAISFIPMLYNTSKSAGLNVKLTCCDAVGWPKQVTFTKALAAAGMEQYLGVITSHTYAGDPTTKMPTKLPVWVTEAGTGDSARFMTTWYSNGGAGEGMTWAQRIAVGMVTGELSAYVYWEGFEVGQTQSGSHVVDASGSTATASGILWAFAMWSRFVRPGAVRVGLSGSLPSTLSAAFKNTDGSIVVVFTNNGSGNQSAKVSVGSGFTAAKAQAWITKQGTNVGAQDASLSGGAATVAIPGKSVVTLKLT